MAIKRCQPPKGGMLLLIAVSGSDTINDTRKKYQLIDTCIPNVINFTGINIEQKEV